MSRQRSRPSLFEYDKLENLARRVHSGQVVFFVGAGFSLDSEGVSAYRLVLRLLARFDGLSWALARCSTQELGGAGAERALRLRQTLRRVFRLGSTASLDAQGVPSEDDRLTTGDDAWALSQNYYRSNEWMCEAFGTLLAVGDGLGAAGWATLLGEVHAREVELLGEVQGSGTPDRLPPIVPAMLAGFPAAARGKALFVDTLGFAEPEVLAGRPHAPRLSEVEASYAGRLRPRHTVLARWAREGLCRSLLTTNYDLLLEGAYRLSGLACLHSDEPGEAPENPGLLTDVSHFTRIGEAVEYFRFGASHRSASITKIHGCAERYRQLRDRVLTALYENQGAGGAPGSAHQLEAAREHLATYLPAIVFTFREIQNWREDAWSRDLLANLLRTRSIVFCGYSAQDRVIHDAFRTIYEEMAGVHDRAQATRGMLARLEGGGASAPVHPPLWMPEVFEASDDSRARAFFLGVAGPLEFDALEILRAASRAEGVANPSQTGHSNYLQFHIERGGRSDGFPSLDQSLRWLWHRSLRFRQRQAIDVDLRRVVTALLGHSCPEREREQVLAHFEVLAAREEAQARGWEARAPDGATFDRTIGWSDRFQVGLLREFAAAETLLRQRRGGRAFLERRIREGDGGFFPFSEHPQWTAWGLVVEIALRRMIAVWRGALDGWAESTPCVVPGQSGRAALSFCAGPERTPGAPRGLAIVLAGMSRLRAPSEVRGAFAARVHHWRLRGAAIPWWPAAHPDPKSPLRALPGTPDAAQLWAWAARPSPTPAMLGALDELLGLESPRGPTLSAGEARSRPHPDPRPEEATP